MIEFHKAADMCLIIISTQQLSTLRYKMCNTLHVTRATASIARAIKLTEIIQPIT